MFDTESSWQVDAAAEKLSDSLFMTPGPKFDSFEKFQAKNSNSKKKTKKNRSQQNAKNNASVLPSLVPMNCSTPRLSAGNKRNKYKEFSQSKDSRVTPKGSDAIGSIEKITKDSSNDRDKLKPSNVITKKKEMKKTLNTSQKLSKEKNTPKVKKKITKKEIGDIDVDAKISLWNKTSETSSVKKKKRNKKDSPNDKDIDNITEKMESKSSDKSVAKKKKEKFKKKIELTDDKIMIVTPGDKKLKKKKETKAKSSEETRKNEIEKKTLTSGSFVRVKKKRKSNPKRNKYAMLAGVNKADKKDFMMKFNVQEYVEKPETKKMNVKNENTEKETSSNEKTKITKRKRKAKTPDESIKDIENDKPSKEASVIKNMNGPSQTTKSDNTKKQKTKHTIFNKGKLDAIFSESQSNRNAPVKNKKDKNSSNKPTESKKTSENKAPQTSGKKTPKESSFHQRMVDQLSAARFRYLNEQLYTCSGQDAYKLFSEDKSAFDVYHKGFQSQVSKWPTNPVDVIIEDIKKQPTKRVVADFGCGDAKIAQSLPNKVHSFDLVSVNEHIVACDIANVPLADNSVDIAVFCLSLMGTNLVDYLKEAHRVLRKKGTLKIAEVVSRFENINRFILQVEKLGFMLERKDESNKMFLMLDFKKGGNVAPSTEPIQLLPCVYKKR